MEKLDKLREKERRLINELKAVRTQITVAENNSTQGRPRTLNYEAVRKVRKQGLSLSKLAQRFGVTRGAIQHALRKTAALQPQKSDEVK